MKNFSYIEDELEKTTEDKNSSVIKDLNIILSLIKKIENLIIIRNYQLSGPQLRFVHEVLIKLFYDQIFGEEVLLFNSNPLLNKGDIKRKVEESRKSRDSDSYNRASKYRLSDFTKALQHVDKITGDEYESISKFKKLSDKNLHAVNLFNLNENIKIINVNNEFLIKDLDFNESIELLEMLDVVLKITLKVLFDGFNKEKNTFNKKQYDDGRKSFVVLPNREEMLENLGEECVMCGNGRISYPKNILFPNGPFLQCDNDECDSILSVNLNLKERKDGGICGKCENDNALLKRIASYNKESKYYKMPYIQCNMCKEYYE